MKSGSDDGICGVLPLQMHWFKEEKTIPNSVCCCCHHVGWFLHRLQILHSRFVILADLKPACFL